MLIIYYKKQNINIYRERYISISRIYSGKRMCVRSSVKSSRNYSQLYKQMSMHVGGKSENDEEIEMNVKRFDERKRTYYVATLTAMI